LKSDRKHGSTAKLYIERATKLLLDGKLIFYSVKNVEAEVRKKFQEDDPMGWMPSECDFEKLFPGKETKYRKGIKHAREQGESCV
jgi:hypothetical protein